jgi:L-cystine uptake protein TcyP (sodium:dicarboxylate symporter family)
LGRPTGQPSLPFENTVHLALARPVGAALGTSGCATPLKSMLSRSWNSTTTRFDPQFVMIVVKSSVISSAGPLGTV